MLDVVDDQAARIYGRPAADANAVSRRPESESGRRVGLEDDGAGLGDVEESESDRCVAVGVVDLFSEEESQICCLSVQMEKWNAQSRA